MFKTCCSKRLLGVAEFDFPLDLNFTILGLEYRVSVYFWDFVVEGLKATEAKAFLLKRSSSLEDFR